MMQNSAWFKNRGFWVPIGEFLPTDSMPASVSVEFLKNGAYAARLKHSKPINSSQWGWGFPDSISAGDFLFLSGFTLRTIGL